MRKHWLTGSSLKEWYFGKTTIISSVILCVYHTNVVFIQDHIRVFTIYYIYACIYISQTINQFWAFYIFLDFTRVPSPKTRYNIYTTVCMYMKYNFLHTSDRSANYCFWIYLWRPSRARSFYAAADRWLQSETFFLQTKLSDGSAEQTIFCVHW